MKQNEYPYVVFRVMAAVYVERPVRFVDEPTKPLNNKEIVIHCPGAFRRGRLTAEARQLLIEAVTTSVQAGGFRQCIVFGPRKSLYIETDGTANSSVQAPSGGVALKNDIVTGNGDSIMK